MTVAVAELGTGEGAMPPQTNSAQQNVEKRRQAQARARRALEEDLRFTIDWITGYDAKAWFNH
jgi:hypothetical protein